MNARLLAIGDIHGCSAALDALLDRVRVGPDDTLITLGDYVDYGLDSSGVLDRLSRLSRQIRLIPLRGNHEAMMLDARKSREHLRLWLNCGGQSALMSYSASDGGEANLADIPDEHWRFLGKTCMDIHEMDTHFFVHAGARSDVPLASQTVADFHWRTFDDPPPHVSGKIMVCGHTPQKSGQPRNLGHAICIDTDACRGGWLTCIDVTHGPIWQANERGEVK
jgi:serine/threonine protein phosphatase 1